MCVTEMDPKLRAKGEAELPVLAKGGQVVRQRLSQRASTAAARE